MLHQSASTRPVPGFEEPEQNPDPGGDSGGIPCDAAVHPTLSATRDDGVVQTSGIFESPALAIDAALSPDGKRVAIATPSQRNLPEHRHAVSVFEYRLRRLTTDPEEPACEPPDAVDVDDDIVAVAYQPDGSLLAQSRSHATLYRLRGHDRDVLPLEGPDASDTGFSLFHNDAGSGIACASCHPEGGEDGRTWVFRDIGPRRTQALNVGLEGTAPFHWKGDMDDIHMIARQVRQGAMGGSEQSGARVDALRDWLFGLTPPNGTRRTSEARVEEGEQLFASLGCASCHAGPSFTSPQSADLGFGPLQTPALRGVALRPPYMHDGRAETLEEAVLDMVEATSNTVDAEQLESLVAYLESL
jgi:mono/diheme cytochrome c family protein